jgi:hypothetical protein
VDPVPDPLLLRKSGSAENRTRTSGSVARPQRQSISLHIQSACALNTVVVVVVAVVAAVVAVAVVVVVVVAAVV